VCTRGAGRGDGEARAGSLGDVTGRSGSRRRDGGELLMPLAALGGGHPGGLNVGGAAEPAALAAGAAALVRAVLLGLVAAVLAADAPTDASLAGAPSAARGGGRRGGAREQRRGAAGRVIRGEADDVGGVERVLVLLP
jgi:hypothetical protein